MHELIFNPIYDLASNVIIDTEISTVYIMHHVTIYFSNAKKFLLTLSASWRWQNLETALSD